MPSESLATGGLGSSPVLELAPRQLAQESLATLQPALMTPRRVASTKSSLARLLPSCPMRDGLNLGLALYSTCRSLRSRAAAPNGWPPPPIRLAAEWTQ